MISRRTVLKTLGAACALAACGPGGGSTSGSVSAVSGVAKLTFAQFPQLASAGGGVVVDSPVGPLVVVRSTASAALAVSGTCTHAGCTVELESNPPLYCPCHGSAFALDGSVLAGPARRPLTKYSAAVESDGISVTLG
jgi:cytochrome b6-f complex iron-sulfur subunit